MLAALLSCVDIMWLSCALALGARWGVRSPAAAKENPNLVVVGSRARCGDFVVCLLQ